MQHRNHKQSDPDHREAALLDLVASAAYLMFVEAGSSPVPGMLCTGDRPW